MVSFRLRLTLGPELIRHWSLYSMPSTGDSAQSYTDIEVNQVEDGKPKRTNERSEYRAVSRSTLVDQLSVMLRPLGEASFSPLAEAGPGMQCSLSVSGLFLKVKRCEQGRDWIARLTL